MIREQSWSTPGAEHVGASAPAPLGRVRAELGDACLVAYLPDGPGLRALVVTRSGSSVEPLGDRRVAEESLIRLRADLDTQAGRAMPRRLAEAVAAATRRDGADLAATIFDPLRRLIGDRELIVVPTGLLMTTPWALLPGCLERPVTVAPSATAWLAAVHRRRARERTSDGTALVAGPGNRRGEEEVRAIAELRPQATVLTGAEATPAATLAALDGRSVAHVAAHGWHQAENALFSALELATGPVLGYDLQRLAMPPAMVVLSCCELGLSDVRPGDESLGMASALLAAGTATVVASAAGTSGRNTGRVGADGGVSATRPGRALAGRVAERAILAGCLRSTLEGQRQVVLVAGEPGVGKTRLAEEAVDQARELGLACALGRASEDEGSPPYWPFLQVFAGLPGRPPTELYGGLAGGDGPTGSARERFRLFEVTAEALVAAAQPSGLLVVLDDLQWADGATVRLLVHLVTGVTPARLMVVATYRDTETVGQEPLRAAVAALAREASVSRVRLGGLGKAEVAAQLAAVTGWEMPDSVAAAIWRRTRGNPFFVGELGRLLVSSTDGQLPDGVRDAVRDRINRLSPLCRTIVAAAAVLGSDVDPVAVAHVTGTDVEAVLAALDEASVAAILTAAPARRFAHDLFREAARLDVPTAERLTLHRRMAEHLSARGDSDARAAEIAFHWLESLPTGDATQAVAWTERAADRAMTQLAWEEAASLYQRALDADDTHGVIAAPDRCRLLLAMAQAQVRAFSLDDARHSLLAAVDIARAAGDVESLARAALTMEGINDVAWEPTSRALCAEVLDKLPSGDSAVRARLLALLVAAGGWAVPEQSRERSAEALAMAERVGDRHALREALRARQMALSGPDGAAERLALGDRLIALGGDSDDDAVLWGRLWRFDALAQLGDLDGAELEVERINAASVRLRSPLAAWHVARCRAAVAAARGRFQHALAYGREAELAAKRAGSMGAHVPSQGLLLMLHNQVGALDSSSFEPTEPHDEAPVPAFQRAMYATWLLAEGRRDEAHRIYRSLPPVDELPPFVHLSAYAILAEFAAQLDDRETAAQMYRLLLPHAELFVCSGAGVMMILGSVRYPLGVAAATMGRLDDAVRHLRAAIDIGEQVGMPPAVAQATHQLARVLARRTRPADRDEAAALATAAATLAERLGMRPLQRQAQDLADSLTGHRPDRLTRREREIAALVAQGLSNRQIAAASHISERTVESHVQHILDKLGFTNRTQIAASVAADAEKFRTGSL